MKVIFLTDVPGTAKRGEVKEVSDGHARNFLIPRGLVEVATAKRLIAIEKDRESRQKKNLKDQERFTKLAGQLSGLILEFKKRGDKSGTIFGSVTELEIARAITEKTGITVKDKNVVMAHHLKKAGDHEVEIDLGNVKTKVKVKIEAV